LTWLKAQILHRVYLLHILGYGESRAMRLEETDLVEAATILIAVGDGVLADSLRFSLELEGYRVKLCDEHSSFRAMAGAEAPGCLVLDHDLYARILSGDRGRRVAGLGFPVVLMVNDRTEKVVANAEQAGVTKVVETPLIGGVLLEAIRAALDTPLGRRRNLN
jgi:FixJ family two-component response regulator